MTSVAIVWEFQLDPRYRQAMNKEWKAAIAAGQFPPSVMPLLLPNRALALSAGGWCEHIYAAAERIITQYPVVYRKWKQFETGHCGPALRYFEELAHRDPHHVYEGCGRCERHLRWRRLLGDL